jgi:hypothetical protein
MIGELAVCFEPDSVIMTLVLLGQLTLQARMCLLHSPRPSELNEITWT